MQVLEPIYLDRFCVSGDVSIAPTASIAPGVLLQADPGCRLVIADGVSIGVGSVVQVCQGMLEIAPGATLGAGVLVVGGSIGANACIGTRSTLWNVAIAPDQVVAADALLGKIKRQDAVAIEETQAEAAIVPPSPTDPILQDPPRSASLIYGKAGLDRLMGSLFPYREALNGSPPSSGDSSALVVLMEV